VSDPTPTEWLIMEVLAARYRLGESSWHFPNTCKRTLKCLAERDWIAYKASTIDGFQQAWLRTDGKLEWDLTDGWGHSLVDLQLDPGDPIPALQRRDCPCGAHVDIVDGRYARHGHDHRDYTCPMSGQPTDGDLSVLTCRELSEVADLEMQAYGSVSARVFNALKDLEMLATSGPKADPYPDWSGYARTLDELPDMTDDEVRARHDELAADYWRGHPDWDARVEPLPGVPTMDLTEEGVGHSDYVQRMIDGLRAEQDDGMDDPRNGIPLTPDPNRRRWWQWGRR
jgi:hypothetical protein